MANQYNDSFEFKINNLYQCSGKEMLQKWANDGLRAKDIASLLESDVSTVAKWAKLYNITFSKWAGSYLQAETLDRKINRMYQSSAKDMLQKWSDEGRDILPPLNRKRL